MSEWCYLATYLGPLITAGITSQFTHLCESKCYRFFASRPDMLTPVSVSLFFSCHFCLLLFLSPPLHVWFPLRQEEEDGRPGKWEEFDLKRRPKETPALQNHSKRNSLKMSFEKLLLFWYLIAVFAWSEVPDRGVVWAATLFFPRKQQPRSEWLYFGSKQQFLFRKKGRLAERNMIPLRKSGNSFLPFYQTLCKAERGKLFSATMASGKRNREM